MTRTVSIFGMLLVVAGCGGPSKVNTELRKKNQDLQSKLDDRERQHQADQATIASLQKEKGTLPTLPAERLAELFTVSEIRIDKLTDLRKEELKVYITPIDAAGDPLKAAGGITVDAFDLSKADWRGQPRLGHWEFPLKEAGDHWYDSIIVSGYALTCPFTPPLPETELTVRVTFIDALTQRTLTAQTVIKSPAAAIAPQTR